MNSNALGGSFTTASRTFTCVVDPGPPPIKEKVNGNIINSYTDPTGTRHPAMVVEDPCDTGNIFSGNTLDGSGWTFTYSEASGLTATSRAGITVVPNVGGTGSYTDTNGNQLTANSSGQYFDTLSSTTPVLTQAGNGTPTNPTTLTYTAPSGANAVYTVYYTQYTVATNFGVSGTNEYGPLSQALVSSIKLPDGSSYTFTYEKTPGSSCTPLSGTYSNNCITARIASIILPTNGQITYTYSGGSNGIESDGSTAGLTRTLTPGGEWQYARTQVSGAHWQTQITSPPDPVNSGSASDVTVIDFQQDGNTTIPSPDFYETQRQVNQGASTLLLTTTRCYNTNYANCPTTAVSSPITQVDTYSQLPNSSVRLSEVLYNSYGLVTDDKEYNYGVTTGAAPGTTNLIRETAVLYATRLGNGIVNKLAQASSLYDFTFREHSPSQGRWLSPDPAGMAAVDPTNPQTWNRFAYVLNNPLSLIDPLGTDCGDPEASGDTVDHACEAIDGDQNDNSVGAPGFEFCSAEYSFGDCGGFAAIFNGAFGNALAQLQQECGFFYTDPNMCGGIQRYDAQVAQAFANDPCVYLNDAGTGIDTQYGPQGGIDQNSSPQECKATGGQWIPPQPTGTIYGVDANGNVYTVSPVPGPPNPILQATSTGSCTGAAGELVGGVVVTGIEAGLGYLISTTAGPEALVPIAHAAPGWSMGPLLLLHGVFETMENCF